MRKLRRNKTWVASIKTTKYKFFADSIQCLKIETDRARDILFQLMGIEDVQS